MGADAEISVVIPTYRRPDALKNCLEALTLQRRRASQVIVVAQANDHESLAVARAFEGRLSVCLTTIDHPGQVQALNHGLTFVHSPLVAITDDDTQPRPDWLERILVRFDDPTVGAVGGRDVIHWEGEILQGHATLVGRVRWYGRVIGNHHMTGVLQDVQFLKGANMSYRRDTLLGFDEHLAGDGPQVCNDMQVSLRVHVSGWRVVWDPSVAVDHFPAERSDEEHRLNPSLRAAANTVHNQTYVLLSLLTGWHRILTYLFSVLIGSQQAPGPITLPLAIARSGSPARSWFGFRANMRGRVEGLLTFVRTGGQPRVPDEVIAASPVRVRT